MKNTALILLLFILTGFGVKAQTYILQEDFSSITTGNNTSTKGSNSQWAGDTNFPTVSSAYQAGGVVKLGTNSAVGSIISKTLDLSSNGGSFNVSFDVKGWTTVEGSIKVTVTGLTAQTVTYTATMSSSFENKVLSFTGGTTNSTIKIETTAKRAFIDNVNVYTSCNPSNLAFANSSVTKMIGDAAFTQTATSLNTGAPIVYSSSATGVATVNSSTGEVSVVGIGSTTISATQASATGYCPASASYSLTITPLPTVTLTDITDITLNAIINHPVTQTINISAVNLSTDLGLAITGTNADLFTLSQYTVTETGGNVPNTVITITYSPTTVGNHTATLTMASAGAMDLTRTLNGISNQLSGINAIQLPLYVGVANGKILFTADSGESLDIYNGVGQKLLHQLTTEGLNTVSVHATGVLLVKLGNRVAKVIL